MREIRQSGSEGGVGRKPYPYPYQECRPLRGLRPSNRAERAGSAGMERRRSSPHSTARKPRSSRKACE